MDSENGIELTKLGLALCVISSLLFGLVNFAFTRTVPESESLIFILLIWALLCGLIGYAIGLAMGQANISSQEVKIVLTAAIAIVAGAALPILFLNGFIPLIVLILVAIFVVFLTSAIAKRTPYNEK